MVFREEEFVYPLMIALTACLCEEIEHADLPEPCQCSVVPGAEAILDYCGECDGSDCGGQAWVRLVGAYPSSQFPAIDDLAATCATSLAYLVEVGIARCIHVGKMNSFGGFTPPSSDDLLSSVRVQTADMAAMRRAIACCLTEKYDDLTYNLGQYTPLSGGDCNGGTWQFTVWSE